MTVTETYEPYPAVPAATPLTLAGEHELLLRQVTSRAADLLAAAAEGRWPAAELQALLGYLRAEVLRQVYRFKTRRMASNLRIHEISYAAR